MQDRPLTAKQAAFTREYVIDNNATQAALRAGYAASCARWAGCTNITKQNVKADIDRRRAILEQKTEITVLYIQKELDRVKKLAEAKHDHSTVTRAIELQGRTIGAFIDKSVNLNVDIGRKPPSREDREARRARKIEAIDKTNDNKDL